MIKENIRDYAYTAGCIDCDGWISIKKVNTTREKEKTPRYKLEVGLNGKDGRVQQFLYGKWGGSIQYLDRSSKDIGRAINGTYIYVWKINSLKAMEMLKKIQPYLRYKKDQAEIAIRFQGHLQKAGSPKISKHELEIRENLYQECKKLKSIYIKPHAALETKCNDSKKRCDSPTLQELVTAN